MFFDNDAIFKCTFQTKNFKIKILINNYIIYINNYNNNNFKKYFMNNL